jgi:hypothetical protein
MFGDWSSDSGFLYGKEAVRCRWIHLEANFPAVPRGVQPAISNNRPMSAPFVRRTNYELYMFVEIEITRKEFKVLNNAFTSQQ